MDLSRRKKAAIIISPNYMDHGREYLADCVESLRRQDWDGETKLFIADNQSTEASFAFLKDKAPEAAIIRNATNHGFAKGNNDAIRLALQEGFDYIILFNMDTIIEANCIGHLVKTAESDASIGAVQARIMLWPDKTRVNSLGNSIHFLGFGYCEGYGEEYSGLRFQSVREICCPSGAAALYKKEVLETTGLFDEEFQMYNEDHDLGWRIWLAGRRCVLAPQAVVYHKYSYAGNAQKYYWLDRNRLLAIIKNYQLSTLLLISLAFVIMEFGLLLFALQRSWLREKLKVYIYFLSFRSWNYILAARRNSQSLRRVKDRDIVGMFSGRIWYEEIGDWKLGLMNYFMNEYWHYIKLILRTKSRANHCRQKD
jgi:GT2 family glycosyltransferase